MKLLDLLVKELPNRGGWPEFASVCCCDPDGEIRFDKTTVRDFYPLTDSVDKDDRAFDFGNTSNGITRDQYESALAASDGWIEWGGGECPVKNESIISVKHRDGLIYDREHPLTGSAEIWTHSNHPGDIIAYRLHKPEINSRASDERLEQDLNECIGQDVDMPEWNGEGLPPVGCACEMQDSKGTWLPVEIIAKNDGFTFGWSYDYRVVLFGDKADEFRPLRTEAEKASSAAIGAMERAWEEVMDKPAQNFELIYDAIAAGKIPGVKLEVK